jgi:hypothetical protein
LADVPSHQWWREPKGKAGGAVIQAVNAIQEVTLGLQTRFLRSMRAFGGNGYMSGGRFPASVGGGVGGPLGMGQRSGPRDNIIYSMVTTVLSQLLDDGPPGVCWLTTHGDYEIQQKAEMLEQFTDGIAYQSGLDAEFAFHILDALITGDGFIEHDRDADNNVYSERVFPAEYMVDIWDGRDRKPRSLYRVGFIDRDVLAAKYPDKRKAIMDCKPQMPAGFTSISATQTNVIPYIKSWHLPTRRFSKDDKEWDPKWAGRKIITLSNDLELCDQEYNRRDFPVTHTQFCLLPTGYHGLGIAEILQGHQLSLNDANRAEYWAWSQVALPRIWGQTGTFNKEHMSSSLSGLLLEGQGAPPVVLNWSATHPDFVKWKADIKASAANLVGVSFMAMSGIKPPGLDSGQAQIEYKDTLHTRFSLLSQWIQEARVDCSRKQVVEAREAYEEDPTWSVQVMGKDFIKRLAGKEVFDDLDEDDFVLKAKPVNRLPKEAAGQIETATQLVQSGFADMPTGRKLITSVPDLGAAADLFNASYDNAKRTAFKMLHEGIMQTPDGQLQDLKLCIQIVTAEALKAEDNDCAPEKVDLCRKWLVQAKARLAPPAPPVDPNAPPPGPPGPGAAPPGGPMAQGMKPPVSPLVPFQAPRQ